MDTVESIRPTVEMLETVIKPSLLVCPVGECGKTFSNSSHLTLHKAKVHAVDVEKLRIREKDGQPSHYFCPMSGCIYHKQRHFSSFKQLKKHYGSVHGEKKFKCSKCEKGFGFNHACRRHEAVCGVIYHCKTCDCPYTTKEALQMHCTRKQHQLPEEVLENTRKVLANKKKNQQATVQPKVAESVPGPQPCIIFISKMDPVAGPTQNPLRQILPKPVIESVIPMTRVTVQQDKISVEKYSYPAKQTAEIQTDIVDISRPLEQRNDTQDHIAQSPKNILRATTAVQVSLVKAQANVPSSEHLKSSTGMQTNLSAMPNRKRHCSIAETQTSGDYILKSAMASADIPFNDTVKTVGRLKHSPRSKVKVGRRQSFKTSEVQTNESFPPKKKRKRRSSGRHANAERSIETQNIPQTTSSKTGRIILDYGSSISTQTQKSYLEEYGQSRQETQPVQNSETQTSLSALFKDVRESLLDNENSAILTDLGITFNDQQSSVTYTDCGTGPDEADIDTANNSQSSADFQSSCFLDLLDAPSTSQDSMINRSEDYDVPQVGTSEIIDSSISRNEDRNLHRRSGVLEAHLVESSTVSGVNRISSETQVTPQKKQGNTSTDHLYLSTYASTAVDFGVQTSISPGQSLGSTKYNPCLASSAAKHMQTQTMTPRSVDFGAQTLSSRCLDFFDRNDGMRIEGQGPMLSSSAGTDMHTQTADDLLDFLMTNMETQTEDLFENGLGLADIETQTPAENVTIDTLVTTETQTNMQSLDHEENDLTLFTDMQTQTHFNVVKFDSGDLTDSHTQTNFELFTL